MLAGSGAYAIAEVFDWPEGLEEKPRQAPQFYIVIAAATLVGLLIAASGLGAIQALFIAAVLNGVIAPVLIAVILRVSNDEAAAGSPPQRAVVQPVRIRRPGRDEPRGDRDGSDLDRPGNLGATVSAHALID